ncbi:MAG: hypothetical protein ACK5QW_07830 [Cyanobacteriota bacterium]|jgi:hypothetical protein
MRTPPPPWSLQWSSNGELSPPDRQDLLLCLCLPGVNTLRPDQQREWTGTGGETPDGGRTPLDRQDALEISSYPYR